jgi:hypothetical protein
MIGPRPPARFDHALVRLAPAFAVAVALVAIVLLGAD